MAAVELLVDDAVAGADQRPGHPPAAPVHGQHAVADVRDNVYAAELPSPFDFESPDPVLAWLDAGGAIIGPEAQT